MHQLLFLVLCTREIKKGDRFCYKLEWEFMDIICSRQIARSIGGDDMRVAAAIMNHTLIIVWNFSVYSPASSPYGHILKKTFRSLRNSRRQILSIVRAENALCWRNSLCLIWTGRLSRNKVFIARDSSWSKAGPKWGSCFCSKETLRHFGWHLLDNTENQCLVRITKRKPLLLLWQSSLCPGVTHLFFLSLNPVKNEHSP